VPSIILPCRGDQGAFYSGAAWRAVCVLRRLRSSHSELVGAGIPKQHFYEEMALQVFGTPRTLEFEKRRGTRQFLNDFLGATSRSGRLGRHTRRAERGADHDVNEAGFPSTPAPSHPTSSEVQHLMGFPCTESFRLGPFRI